MGSPLLWFGNAAKLLKSALVFPGSTSGSLTVQPAAVTTDHTLTMPAAQGASGAALTNDGSGGLSWALPSAPSSQPGLVNFIGLNSSFAANQGDSVNFEVATGNWATYSSGTTQPTTLTGGSATQLTLSRTTTTAEILDGAASGKIAKSAANAQGQGVSCVGYIPVGWRGQNVTITFPFKVVSGSLVSGDLLLFIEDVTNAAIIVPSNNGVNGSGQIIATFSVPATCSQIRLGIHFATTVTNALTFSFDDVFVGPVATPIGLAGSNVLSASISPTSFGTVSNNSAWVWQTGDKMQGRGSFQAGTTAAAAGYLTLPNSYSIDTSKFQSQNKTAVIGRWHKILNSGNNTLDGTSAGPLVLDTANPTRLNFSFTVGPSNVFIFDNVSGSIATSDTVTYEFEVPIAGWDANVISSNSRVFNISSYLANGSRVTGSAPTQLGQYRSYLRDANAYTFTETNGDPTTAPSIADGIRIYQGNAYNTADTNNQPTRFEIFVGKNKSIEWRPYLSSGRTGFISFDTSTMPGGTVRNVGYVTEYDPTTGIATITASRITNDASTVHRPGTDNTGSAEATDGVDPYFDIVVSDNPLPVQSPVSIGNDYVRLDTDAGAGSTNTKVRNFTNINSSGSSLTGAVDATNGASITVNVPGIYAVQWNGARFTANDSLEIAINNTAFVTMPSISVLTYFDTISTTQHTSASATMYLQAGTVIRSLTFTASLTASNAAAQFLQATRVG